MAIPVFFACDNAYAPFVTTAAASMMAHTRASIDFYLISPDLSADNQSLLTFFFRRLPNTTFHLVPVADDMFAELPVGYHYTSSMYLRFLIPELCPHLDKVIYSDVDVIYCDDIGKMYDTDLNAFGLAAPVDEIGDDLGGNWRHSVRKKKLGIPETHSFFQSGNLVIGGNYWRYHGISHRLIENAMTRHDDVVAPDMDILNLVFANRYQKLEYRYSACTNRMGRESLPPEVEAAHQNPFCIHYAGLFKPWNKKNVPLAQTWWRYALESPYKDYFLKQYREHTLYRPIKRTFYKVLYKMSGGQRRVLYKSKYKSLVGN